MPLVVTRDSSVPKEPAVIAVSIVGVSPPRCVTRLSAPPRLFLPCTADGPRSTSARSTASNGIRSKNSSCASGSLMRTPSRKTLIPCGTPATGDTVNPRS